MLIAVSERVCKIGCGNVKPVQPRAVKHKGHTSVHMVKQMFLVSNSYFVTTLRLKKIK